MGAGLTESRKNGRFQAVPVLLPAFVDIFKESGQIKDKVFVFFFQPPNGIKEFFYSFFFHDSSEIQKMDTAVIRVRFHFVFFQVNSRTGQNNLTICRYDVSFAKFAGVFFIFKKTYFTFRKAIRYSTVTNPASTGFGMQFQVPVRWHNRESFCNCRADPYRYLV